MKLIGSYCELYGEKYLIISVEIYFDKVCMMDVNNESYYWFNTSEVFKDGEFYPAEHIGGVK